MDDKRSRRSPISRLMTRHQTWLTSHRLILTSLACGYLFYYIASTQGTRIRFLFATWSIVLLLMLAFEDWRRYFYLWGRRSARSHSGKLLS